MDLMRSTHKRNRVSEVIYVLLNIALVVVSLIAIIATSTPWIALLLVVLSKWRVFAVRPRYWIANISTNFVDFVVGISFVILMNAVTTANMQLLWLQLVFALLYMGWLLYLKPRSKRVFVIAQAGVALFFGIWALSILTHSIDTSVFVVGVWLITLTASRHAIAQYEEENIGLYSVMWAALMAQVAFICHRWLTGYVIPGARDFFIPQAAIIVILAGFVGYRVYKSYHLHGEIRAHDVLLPSVFSGLLVLVLVVIFNAPSF